MNTYSLKRSTQIAILAGAGSGTEEKTVSGTTPLTLSDSVAGNIRTIEVKGSSAVSAGSIVSVGDVGWAPVDMGSLTWTKMSGTGYDIFYAPVTNIVVPSSAADRLHGILSTNYPIATDTSFADMEDNSMLRYNGWVVVKDNDYTDATVLKTALSGAILYYEIADTTGATAILGIISKDSGHGTAATITTGLPLRSTTDGTVYDELTNTKVITRCEVVEGVVVPLTTPVETPLTSAEVAALAALETYSPTTIISVTDDPSVTVKYRGTVTTRTAPKKHTSRKKKS